MTASAYPWCGRNPADWAEADVPTRGGLYGWDHDGADTAVAHHRGFPVPTVRVRAWRAAQVLAGTGLGQLRLVA